MNLVPAPTQAIPQPPGPFAPLSQTRVYGPGHLAPVENPIYQATLEQALDDGNGGYIAHADPRTHPSFAALVNPNPDPATTNGRGNNEFDSALAGLSTFLGRPEVAAPRYPDINPARQEFDFRTPERNAAQRMARWLGIPLGSYDNGARSMTQQFEAIHTAVQNMGEGSAAVISHLTQARDQNGTPLFGPDNRPRIGGAHFSLIVFPKGASGPLWWNPHTGDTAQHTPQGVIDGAIAARFVPIPPGTVSWPIRIRARGIRCCDRGMCGRTRPRKVTPARGVAFPARLRRSRRIPDRRRSRPPRRSSPCPNCPRPRKPAEHRTEATRIHRRPRAINCRIRRVSSPPRPAPPRKTAHSHPAATPKTAPSHQHPARIRKIREPRRYRVQTPKARHSHRPPNRDRSQRRAQAPSRVVDSETNQQGKRPRSVTPEDSSPPPKRARHTTPTQDSSLAATPPDARAAQHANSQSPRFARTPSADPEDAALSPTPGPNPDDAGLSSTPSPDPEDGALSPTPGPEPQPLGRVIGQGTLAPLENPAYQNDVENALRSGEGYLVGADPRTNPFGRLVNDGGPGQPGRAHNCADCVLAGSASFHGYPTVSLPISPVISPDGRFDYSRGEAGGARRVERILGQPLNRLADSGESVPNQFETIYNDVRRLGRVRRRWSSSGGWRPTPPECLDTTPTARPFTAVPTSSTSSIPSARHTRCGGIRRTAGHTTRFRPRLPTTRRRPRT